MNHHPQAVKRGRRAGFTLIEMLTVVAIIGILAALLLPALQFVIRKAEVARAQTAVYGLATAFKAYFTEYGKWPSTSGSAMPVTTDLIDPNGAGNPRKIVFYDFPTKDLNGTTYLDPWKNPYQVQFDSTYSGSITLPDGSGSSTAGVIIWSYGPTGSNTAYGVTSWK